MTFQEAEKIKNSYPKPYTTMGIKCEVYITPFEQREYEQFLKDFSEGDLKDVDNYKTNGNYKVVALAKSEFKVVEIEIKDEN